MATLADQLFEQSTFTKSSDTRASYQPLSDVLGAGKPSIGIANKRTRYDTGRGASVRYQQVARIIHHLSRDVRVAFPHLTIPSYEIIACLARNAFRAHHFSDKDWSDKDWQSIIVEVLHTIREQTDVGLDGNCHYTLADDTTPLFPNPELFDEWDAFRFAQALLHYLEKELN